MRSQPALTTRPLAAPIRLAALGAALVVAILVLPAAAAGAEDRARTDSGIAERVRAHWTIWTGQACPIGGCETRSSTFSSIAAFGAVALFAASRRQSASDD